MAILGFGTAYGQPPPPPGGGTVDYEISYFSDPGTAYPNEISWELVPSAGGAVVASVACGTFDPNSPVTVTLDEGTSYDFVASDDWGDGWNGWGYTITELPCGVPIHSEVPDNGQAGDGSLGCGELDIESTFVFTATEACPDCLDPAGATASNVMGTTATISWTGAADFWGIEYIQDTYLIQTTPVENPVYLSGLTPETTYTVYIAGICGITPTGIDSVTFTTGVMATPNDACDGAILIPVADDTTIVMNGNYENGPAIDCSSGAEDDAWLTFMGTGAPVVVYGSVQGPVTDFAMEIWDGCPGAGGSLVLCDDDANDPPSGLMPMGEFCTVAGQSYYIRYWEFGASTPGSVMGITVKENRPVIAGNSNVGQNGMTINFTGYTGGDAQVIRYHMFGDSPNYGWKNRPATANSGYINNLTPGTRYTVRVGTRCPGENAAYGDTATFWTRSLPCPAPISVGDTVSGFTSAYVFWGGSADSYKVRYRAVGDTNWMWLNTTEVWNEISGLTPGTTYEWQVRAICNAGGNMGYGSVETFTTWAPPRLASVNAFSVTAFNLYPNPTNGSVTVEFNSEVAENITFNVTDLSGKLVMSNTVAANEGSNRVYMELNDLEAGVYLTTLSNENGISERVRVILK